MSTQATKINLEGEYTAEGKARYLLTGGGAICCKRCTASSTRTKEQCGRPALKASRTQKCQFHGGRPHKADVLQRISEANLLHGEATKAAKLRFRQIPNEYGPSGPFLFLPTNSPTIDFELTG